MVTGFLAVLVLVVIGEEVLGALSLPCVPLVDGWGCRCCGRVSSVCLEVVRVRGVVGWVDQVLEDCSVLMEDLKADEVLGVVLLDWLVGTVVGDGLVLVVVLEAEICI